MTIEAGVTYISDLDSSYPAEGEVGTLHEGNDHIRNIKFALENTFPNVNGAVNASDEELNALVGVTATAEQLNSPTTATKQTVSGVAVSFLSIPSWVSRVTVNLVGVSTDGVAPIYLRIGSAATGFESSGYISHSAFISSDGYADLTDADTAVGFVLGGSEAGRALHGAAILSLVDRATNLWSVIYQGSSPALSGLSYFTMASGSKALGGTLDRVQLASVDNFDAGSINIMYD